MPEVRPSPWLTALAENLACRSRLGFGLVTGGNSQLADLDRLANPGPPLSPLNRVRRELGECTRCRLHEKRKKLVFGAGPEDAAIMLIGEGPGQQEDQKGEPFVGPAGRLLDQMLTSVGIARNEVYITNIVKCRPPGNRDPQPDETEACAPFLKGQVEAIGPRVIMALGRPASQTLLETSAPISALRGRWQEYMGTPLMPTFHPAYLLRNPARKKEAYRDLKALVKALKGAG